MMNIYLYIKQHKITGLKYFGKTRNDPYSYAGSGKYWVRHIKQHGREYIETTNVFMFSTLEEASEYAINFSEQNDIVKSKDWANLVIENALQGVPFNDDTRRKISNSLKGKKISEETRKKLLKRPKRILSEETKSKISAGNMGKIMSNEAKEKISTSNKGKPRKLPPRTEEHQRKLNESNLGLKRSDETRRKLSESHKGHIPVNKGKKMSEEQKEKLKEAWVRRKERNQLL